MKQPKKKTKKRDLLDTLCDKRDRALERVVALWGKDQDVIDALDALTLAHVSATFKHFIGMSRENCDRSRQRDRGCDRCLLR
jgi:hypothetical protein